MLLLNFKCPTAENGRWKYLCQKPTCHIPSKTSIAYQCDFFFLRPVFHLLMSQNILFVCVYYFHQLPITTSLLWITDTKKYNNIRMRNKNRTKKKMLKWNGYLQCIQKLGLTGVESTKRWGIRGGPADMKTGVRYWGGTAT